MIELAFDDGAYNGSSQECFLRAHLIAFLCIRSGRVRVRVRHDYGSDDDYDVRLAARSLNIAMKNI